MLIDTRHNVCFETWMVFFYSHFDAASNLSLFFFRRHFHGLNRRPSALNLLFRSNGGVLVPVLRLVVRSVVPLCFLTAIRARERKKERETDK